MRFCEECGAPLEEGAMFCDECGAAVDMTEEESESGKDPAAGLTGNEAMGAASEDSQVPSQSNGDNAAEKPKKEKSKKSGLIAIVCIAVVVGVLVFVFRDSFLGKSGGDKDKNSPALPSGVSSEAKKPTTLLRGTSTPAPTDATIPTKQPTPTDAPVYAEESDYDKFWNANLWYDTGFYFYDSDSRYLKPQELWYLSKKECQLARNEIYARLGRKFLTSSIQDYFNSCSWYTPIFEPTEFDEDWLNEYEKANVKLLADFEKNYATDESSATESYVYQRVAFAMWSDTADYTALLEFTGSDTGNLVLDLWYVLDGEWYEIKESYRFVMKEDMSGIMYDWETDEAMMTFQIRCDSYNGEDYFTIELFSGENSVELIEYSWAIRNAG